MTYYKKIATVCAMSTISFATISPALDITLSDIETVAQNSNTNVSITLSEPAIIQLVLRKTNGDSGEAVFASNDSAEIILTNKTSAAIRGVTPSSVSSNLLLEVLSGTNLLASDSFTVVDTTMISFDTASSIAREHIEGKVPTQEISSTGVVLQNNLNYCVTFYCTLPENTLGPDFVAQVWVDAYTGDVLFAWQGI